MAEPEPAVPPKKAVSRTKRKKKRAEARPRTLHRYAEPQVDYLAACVTRCRDGLTGTWHFLATFDYTLGGTLPFTLAEFERAVVDFAVLVFGLRRPQDPQPGGLDVPQLH
jgi:hypothetical protein